MNLDQTLLKVVNAFKEDDILFALAGGFAFSIHIIPRATVDIDFVIFTGEDTKQIELSLKKVFKNLIPHKESIKAGSFEVWRFIGIDDEETIIDILISGNPEFTKNAAGRMTYLEYNNTNIPILSVEDIYLMKKNSTRPQDISDCRMIEEVKKDNLDWNYIRKMTG